MGMPCGAKAGLPGLHQQGLARGGGGLLVVEPGRGPQAEMPAAERDRARGNDDHRSAALPQRHNVVCQASQPGGTRAFPLAADQQRGADLDDETPGSGEGRAVTHRRVTRTKARLIMGVRIRNGRP